MKRLEPRSKKSTRQRSGSLIGASSRVKENFGGVIGMDLRWPAKKGREEFHSKRDTRTVALFQSLGGVKREGDNIFSKRRGLNWRQDHFS